MCFTSKKVIADGYFDYEKPISEDAFSRLNGSNKEL
jgi:DNA-directed RNA polymerase subunit N (RpoN/RPB10)